MYHIKLQVNNDKHKVQKTFNMVQVHDGIEYKYKQIIYKGTTLQWHVIA